MLINDSHARPKRPVAIRSLSTWRPAASSTQFLDQRADLVPINLGRDRTHLLEHNPPLAVDDEGFGNAVDAPLDGDPAIEVGAGPRIGIAQIVQPLGGVLDRKSTRLNSSH